MRPCRKPKIVIPPAPKPKPAGRKIAKKARDYNKAGLVYFQKLDYTKAIESFKSATDADPNFAEAYNNAGLVYLQKAEYQKAIESFTSAINADPAYAEAYYNRGNTYTNNIKKDYLSYLLEISNYKQAAEVNPKYVMAFVNLGNAYQRIGDFDAAIEAYSKAIDLNPPGITPTSFDPIYTLHINRGTAYRGKGDYEAAISDYTKAIEINPNNFTAFVNRGDIYKEKKKDYDAAISDYNKALDLYNGDASAARSLAEIKEAIRVFDEENSNWKSKVGANLTNAATYFDRGKFYLANNRFADAKEDFKKAIELNPNFTLAYFNLGNACSAMKNHEGEDEAISSYQEAISRNEQFADAYYRRGLVYSGKGDYGKAFKDYTGAIEAAIKSHPEATGPLPYTWIYYLARGLALMENKDYEGSRKDFDKCIEINKKGPDAYRHRAVAWDALGEKDKADEDRRTAAMLYLGKSGTEKP